MALIMAVRHSRIEVINSIAALRKPFENPGGGGWLGSAAPCGVNYAIVHSENETDRAKRGIRACALDLMIELVPDPPHAPESLRPKVIPSGPEAAFLRTVGETCLAIGRLRSG
jgi:putative DNA methylase